jgi:hypothetical protein
MPVAGCVKLSGYKNQQGCKLADFADIHIRVSLNIRIALFVNVLIFVKVW